MKKTNVSPLSAIKEEKTASDTITFASG